MSELPPYSPRTRWLHWLTVPLLGVSALTAFAGEGLTALRAHALVGVTVFMLMLVRFFTRRPAPPPMPPPRRRLYEANHRAIYVLVAALAITGAAMVSNVGLVPVLLGDAPLPATIPHIPHQIFAYGLIGMIVAHVLGVAIYQARTGDVLGRMLPRRPETPTSAQTREAES